MYMNFWYPVAASDQVTNERPVRARILTLDFVAFRDAAGRAHVLADTCVHRGGSLGKGKVRGDTVECPYHGWQYAGNGHCTAIPTLAPDEKPPARAKVDSYPVQERYGIVFAFLGDLPEEERPPLWDMTEYDDPAWRANKLTIFDVNCYYERSIENGLDPAHNEIVHPKQGAPGMRQDVRGKPIEVEDIGEFGSRFMIPFTQPEQGAMGKGMERDSRYLRAGSGHLGPNQLVTWLQFSKDSIFHQYFFEAPIDENRTRIFFVNMRRFMLGPEHDERIMKVNMEVAQEDINILLDLNPVRTPHSTTLELLLPADRPIVRYRQFLNDWERRGWRLDLKRLRELRGDVAFAIPCPDRRLHKNWVLPPAPLMKPAER
jgi:phenylpropionate dioxygenase-like ring-hydroxylating dioxygenase large terminal subunit